MSSLRALLIGVAEYDSMNIPPLPCVPGDIRDLEAELQTHGYSTDRADSFRPGWISRNQVVSAVGRFLRSGRSGETLLVYLSGHGFHVEGYDYLAVSDVDLHLQLRHTAVPLGSWQEDIDHCSASGIIFLVDACREGIDDTMSITNSQWSRQTIQRADRQRVAWVFPCGLGQVARYVRGDSDRAPVPFSLFARSVVTVLRSHTVPITLGQFASALQESMDELTRQHSKPRQDIRVITSGRSDIDQLELFPLRNDHGGIDNYPAGTGSAVPDGTLYVQANSSGEGQDNKTTLVDQVCGVQFGDHNTQINYFGGEQDKVPSLTRRPVGSPPYLGRKALGEADWEVFFGRDKDVRVVMERLSAGQSAFLMLSGLAGAGKSSLLRAGVLRELMLAGLPGKPEACRWPRLVFSPGSAPLDELAIQLSVLSGDSTEAVHQALRAGPDRFVPVIKKAAVKTSGGQSQLIVAIDQFEQVFTDCRIEQDRRAFIDALHSASESGAARVLVTVNSDFLNRCARYPQLSRMTSPLALDRYDLAPMTDAGLRSAITGPASWAGAQVEHELVDRLVAETLGRANALPLLSHALEQTWQVHSGNTMTVADYEASGAVISSVEATVADSESSRSDVSRSDLANSEEAYTAAVQEKDLGDSEWAAKVEELRRLVANTEYEEAQERLESLVEADPERAEPVRQELGFVMLTGKDEQDRRVIAAAWRATAPGHEVLSRSSLGGEVPDAATGDPSEETPDGSATAEAAAVTSAASSTTVIRLFQRFFTFNTNAPASRVRERGAANPFGYDIDLDGEYTVVGTGVRCRVEWKDFGHEDEVENLEDKLGRQRSRQASSPIEHWIVISPHRDPSAAWRGLLGMWERYDVYPFSLQVWSPSTGVRDLFAMEPEVFRALYDREPTLKETAASSGAAERFRERLAPRLRIAPLWRSYLDTPHKLCFNGSEDPDVFERLHRNHLPLKAADEHGTVLDAPLMDTVTAWAHDGDPQKTMLLLADFGEGKSVFTYCLARRLAEEFRAAPGQGILPVRVPLGQFHKDEPPQEFLRRQLDAIGITFDAWRTLAHDYRTLVILDGFDEMSVELTPTAVTRNLKALAECVEELSRSKILVTSRQRVMEGSRDWDLTLEKLRHPTIIRIGPGPRRERVKYLKEFAADEESARWLENLPNLHDPIGLAAKPLFLEMIKGTLQRLPRNRFNEAVLYEHYTDESLRRKNKYLDAPDGKVKENELIANLMGLLEDVAVDLHESEKGVLLLRDHPLRSGREKIAERLWEMHDDPAPHEPYDFERQEDATARVGIRSLLMVVPVEDKDKNRWPVNFFHRSMREYFVARALVRALSNDLDRARQLLSRAPLLPEITHFVAMMLGQDPPRTVVEALETLTLSARAENVGTANDPRYVGGNALTLLYAVTKKLSRLEWSRLSLDHVKLPGADLRGADFTGSFLRYASLNNTNLENANLTGADLEGVLLEETSRVAAIASAGGDTITTAYGDGTLRQWQRRPGAVWEPKAVAALERGPDRMQLSPQGRVIAVGDGRISVRNNGGADGLLCEFMMDTRCRDIAPGVLTTLVTDEGEAGHLRVTRLDSDTLKPTGVFGPVANVVACAQLDGAQYAVATSEEVHVIWPEVEGGQSVPVTDAGVTCLFLAPDGPDNADSVLLATGHHDGSVAVTRVCTTGDADPLWEPRQLHQGPVTAIALDAEERVITGGADRSVCVIPLAVPAKDKGKEAAVERLRLTLRCKGVRYAGVNTEREQAKLREYSQ